MITGIQILGGHIQALGLVRQVKALGLCVQLITNDSCAVARWSKDVDKVWLYKHTDELLPLVERISHPDWLLFPTSDDYIDWMVAYRRKLEKMCMIALPSNEIVALFADKRQTYKFCEKHNIPHPHSFYPNDMDDVCQIATQTTYPCVIKPGVMYSFHKLMGKKAYRANNREELLSIMERIEQMGFPINQMLIQEFLSGGAKVLYSYGTFAVDGKSLVSIQANRIRQNPMDFGNSTTFAITCDIPQITTQAEQILALTHYTGMGEIEFMYDEQSGDYKFLEINTRAWKWHTISNGLGFSFIGAWVKYLNDDSIPVHNTASAAWCERLTDWTVCVKEIFKGRMTLRQVIESYRLCPVNAVWSWRDPLPAIMYIILSPILYIKRY